MINAVFYTFAKKANSSAIPPANSGLSIPIEIKSATNMLSPEIVITQMSTVYLFNYVYIPTFARYYHIVDWRVENNLWIGICRVDVLATYRDTIGATSQYILRSSAEFDGTIVDTAYPTKYAENIYSTTVDTITQNRNIILGATVSSGYFVVGVIDRRGAFGCLTYYVLNTENFNSLMYTMFHDASYTQVQDISQDLVKCLFNPFDYIVSVLWFPVSSGYIPARGGTWSLQVGYWEFNISALMLSDTGCAAQTFTLPASTFGNHPQISRGAYLNGAPYRSYSMNFPPYGTIEIPPEIAMHGATLYESVDFITGKSTLTFFAGTGANATTEPILTVDGEIGIPLQIAQIKPADMAGEYEQFKVSMGTKLAGMIADILPGDIGGVIKNNIAGIGETKLHENVQIKTSGSQGGFGAYYRFQQITAQAVSQLIVDEDNNRLGRPLCKIRRPDAIPGYMAIGSPAIAITGTHEEQLEIIEHMRNGFYFE